MICKQMLMFYGEDLEIQCKINILRKEAKRQ